MDEKKLLEMFQKAIEDGVPSVAQALVEKAVADKFEGLEKQLADLNKNVKLGASEDVDVKEKKKEAMEVMANYFKSASKKDFVGASAILKEFGKKATYLNEGVDAEGGYMVPVEFAKEVFYVAGEFGLARKYCTIIPMSTDTKNISSLTNAVVAYWTDEGVAYTESKPTVAQIQLIAYKATALVSATLELVDDQMTNEEIWNLTKRLIAEKLAEFEDTNVLVSSSKLEEILTSANINIVNMANGDTSFADLSYSYLIDVIRAVNTKYKKGQPRWFMSQDIVARVEKMKDTTGQPILQFSRDLKSDLLQGRLLGFPIEMTDVMPDDADDAISTQFILFGDLKYYAFGDRRQLTFDVGYLQGNREKDIQSLKASERIAGKILAPTAFACLKTAAA